MFTVRVFGLRIRVGVIRVRVRIRARVSVFVFSCTNYCSFCVGFVA